MSDMVTALLPAPIRFCMIWSFVPLIVDTIAIIAAIPMITPSMVRNDLILCDQIPCTAYIRFSNISVLRIRYMGASPDTLQPARISSHKAHLSCPHGSSPPLSLPCRRGRPGSHPSSRRTGFHTPLRILFRPLYTASQAVRPRLSS